MDLWNSGENQILIDTVIDLETQKNEAQADNYALLIWIAQSIGYLHMAFHNANFTDKLKKNPAFEAAPPRVKKLLGLDKKETEYTDEDIWNGFFPQQS